MTTPDHTPTTDTAGHDAKQDTGHDTSHDAGRQDLFVQEVTEWVGSFLAERAAVLGSVSADATALTDAIASLAAGGKRMRALMCYWGWRGAGGDPGAREIVVAGSALELFQTAALIHDDIIDNSDTRRGSPSVHRRFAALHQSRGWALEAGEFGAAAATLAGDMCLSFSEEAFTAVGPAAGHDTVARRIFNRMRTEVMAGQYLDVLEEVAGGAKPVDSAVQRAQAIIRYKAAKYSTEHPLALGGALAGADRTLLKAYSAFALPLGEAFQLRDDVLGVFGDPASTGKPAGDDLREGKRTVLIGYGQAHGRDSDRAFIEDHLGDGGLDDAAVGRFRDILIESGALAATEALIAEHRDRAFDALERLDVDSTTRTALTDLAVRAISRTA